MGSSTIKDITYDPLTQIMEIEFFSGGKYRYHGVSPEEHEAFKSAESLGQHFHKHVKPKYRTEKL